MDEYSVLLLLNIKDQQYVNVLNVFPDKLLADALVKRLISEGLVAGRPEAYGYLRITPAGRIRFSELKQSAEEMRRKDAEEHHHDEAAEYDT